jgi:predicted O-linked N-acetylglucosamine transferase (SPINDLY family)
LRRSLALSLAVAEPQPLQGDPANVTQHWLHLRQKQCRWPLLADWPGLQPDNALLAASALSTLALTDDPHVQLATARRFLATRIQPALTPLAQRRSYGHPRLRIAYLSGDFCTHPLSLLMVELFELHDRSRFEIYGYCWSPQDGSGLRQRVINAMQHFTRIDTLGDTAAAQRIRADEIDILVDLQGLTAGARPQLLALRPAPIQITWLGFPGSSGHPDIDYLIADAYVIPPEFDECYSESVLYLPHCFQPSDRQREVATPPSRAQCGLPDNAFVFCCFNNNYKITPEVFECWLRILHQVPGSVLWLLADNPWAQAHLLQTARQGGLDPARLVFAQRTAPALYLARYLAADLFLDTYPFNAGTTANDALWLGLPLLTCSGRAFASRMAASLLHHLGLDALISTDLADYEARAVALARSPAALAALRQQLAAVRHSSRVFDMPRLARDLEALYAEVATRPDDQPPATMAAKRRVFLHVGCGGQRQADTLPIFNTGEWDEIRQDIDPAAQPDMVGSMTDLGALADGAVGAVYSSHNIEHLYPHEVALALREFRRVLQPDGFVIITCPDLQAVCALVADDRLHEVAYLSPAGPIAPIDILFGLRQSLAAGDTGMAHKTGFTRRSLQAALAQAGFASVAVIAQPAQLALWAVATRNPASPARLAELIGHTG